MGEVSTDLGDKIEAMAVSRMESSSSSLSLARGLGRDEADSEEERATCISVTSHQRITSYHMTAYIWHDTWHFLILIFQHQHNVPCDFNNKPVEFSCSHCILTLSAPG